MDVLDRCPVCGAIELPVEQEQETSTLLAVCDVLAVKALEVIGKRIVRDTGRERLREWRQLNYPYHRAHTVEGWQLPDDEVIKALRGAWDVVPALVNRHVSCCTPTSDAIVSVLDIYVRDLVITGLPHDIRALRDYFKDRLYLPLHLKEPEDDDPYPEAYSRAGLRLVPGTGSSSP